LRTISIRLDDDSDAALVSYCRRHGVTQTDAVKIAIGQLAGLDRVSPAELAAELGLIGAFRSAEGDLAKNHSQRIKERLRVKRKRDSMPVPQAEAAAARATRRRTIAA
jgi:hypothetical protein